MTAHGQMGFNHVQVLNGIQKSNMGDERISLGSLEEVG